MKKEIFEKITSRKEFSQLPRKDIEKAFEQFNSEKYSDEEKIKHTRWMLKRIFSGFSSIKLLSTKNKSYEWILHRHFSTRERIPYYSKIYKRIFKNTKEKITLFDLGAGVNGFSYDYFEKLKLNIKYIGVEAVGQLVNLMNNYFRNEKKNAKAFHLSLFELEKIKNIIKKEKKPKIVFLFKTIDSLELLERDYTKKFLPEIVPIVDKVVVSFATKSMLKRDKIFVKRTWFLSFIREKFLILDDFEIGNERYIVFKKR